MTRKVLFILCLSALSIFAMSILYLISGNAGDEPHPFERLFLDQSIEFTGILSLESSAHYIAGFSTKGIYVGNKKDPAHLLFSNWKLKDTHSISIQIPEKYKLMATRVTIDSPSIFLSDMSSHTLFHGSLEDFRIKPFMKEPVFLASGAVPVSPSAFAIRTWKDSLQELVLARRTIYPPYLEKKPDLLEKQVDGIFCTDGMLHHNKELHQLLYIYHYRNQFICMDTSLNLLYRGLMLDTISYAGVQLSEVQSDQTITTSTPPKMTKGGSCTYGPWLFVHSKLRASNEDQDTFQGASAIDVYDLTRTGKYVFSFYLPKYKGYKARTFKVFQNRLVALYDRYLVTYELTLSKDDIKVDQSQLTLKEAPSRQ